MRLADWSLHFYRLPYEREVRWSNAVEDSGTFALLRLVADNGATGIAEGTLKATWSGVSPRSVKAALEDILMPLVGSIDLADPDALTRALAPVPENRLAKALIENASWTLRAAAAGKPLWHLWAGRQEVALTWAVTRQAPGLMAAEAEEMCARHGFATLKVKGGQGMATDVQALGAIRAAVGPAVELYVDANSAYPRDEAGAYVRAIAEAGATVAEDPCTLLPDESFAALQRDAPLPVLIDVNCVTGRDAALFLERGARALSTKPGRVGLSETRLIAQLAAAHGARVAVGIYAESALGTLISLQQAAALAEGLQLVAAEQSFFLCMREQVVTDDVEIRAGRIRLPDEPDYARLVDWEKVKHFAIG